MDRKTFLLVVTLCITVVFAGLVWSATTGKIVGVITDKKTGEGLPGANILIEGTKYGAVTDVQGRYLILNVPPGSYSIKASMVGYNSIVKTELRVRIDQTTTSDFALDQTVIAGQQVTVVAERPIVELDLTASKQVISGQKMTSSWVASIDDAIRTQSGVNINGGIRGGFGLDVNYIVDGQVVRDGGANSALIPVNMTSVQEMEVLTGGWNAEYPQANSGIVNIVTKSGGTKYHGSARYRFRPAGVYHWGRHVYSKQGYEWWETLPNGQPGLNSLAYWTKNDGGHAVYKAMTPQQRLEKWREFMTPDPVLGDYDKRNEWELESSFNGPVPFIPNLGFNVSGRWLEGVGVYPGAYKYQPEYNVQVKLDYRVTPSNRIVLSGMHFKTKNSGRSRTPYLSTEDVGFASGNARGFFYSPYNAAKFWPWGGFGVGGGESLGRIQPPERMWQYQWQAKWTHTFSKTTFMDVSLQNLQFRRSSDFLDNDKGYYQFKTSTGPVLGNAAIMGNGMFQGFGGQNDTFFDNAFFNSNNLKVDLLSQATPHHQIKVGAEVSLQYFRRAVGTSAGNRYAVTNNIYPGVHPWEASAYLQDKIEIKGMIVNAGLRMDMYNGNKMVNYDVFDPYGLYIDNKVHPADIPYRKIAFEPDSPFAVKTPTQIALSPRVGISHPISSTTVLHFMYGHFNQRPGWIKIISDGSLLQNPSSPNTIHDLATGWQLIPRDPDPQAVVTWYNGMANQSNPLITFEKYIQYEIGFEQNIADLLTFDLTMYYKDGKNLTTLGYQRGYGAETMNFTTGISTTLYPDTANAKVAAGSFVMPINGAYSNARGLELEVNSRFSRFINFQAAFNMSFSMSDKYGPRALYRNFATGKVGKDLYWGGTNTDRGNSGNPNDKWNPRNTFKFVADLNTPKDFGPSLGSISPLGEWFLNVYFQYASGRKFTYHSVIKGDLSSEPNNMTWKPFYSTNIKVSKMIKLFGSLRTELKVTAINAFNNKQLRLLSGSQLADYMEYGKLPNQSVSGEPDVWNWYEQSLLPRQIHFGIGLEF